MMENIVQSIICSQFDIQLGRGSHGGFMSAPHHAMIIKFSLTPNWELEDGYRHLSILIFGGGANYIGVYGKLDWNVTRSANYIASDNPEYIKGETPWVLYGYQ